MKHTIWVNLSDVQNAEKVETYKKIFKEKNMNFENALDSLEKYLEKDKVKIMNPQKLKDIMATYKILNAMISLHDKAISVEINEGALELGDFYIRIVAPQFTSYELKALAQAISKADIIDIYPTADDRIKIDIMFYKAYYVSTL